MYVKEKRNLPSNKSPILDYWLSKDIKEKIKLESNPNVVYNKMDNGSIIKSTIKSTINNSNINDSRNGSSNSNNVNSNNNKSF